MTASESSRGRRFALPDLADARADEVIEAFLTGPERRRGRPFAPPHSRPFAPDPLTILTSRLAWQEALQREAARNRRYGRPVSVAVITLRPAVGSASRDPGRRLPAASANGTAPHDARPQPGADRSIVELPAEPSVAPSVELAKDGRTPSNPPAAGDAAVSPEPGSPFDVADWIRRLVRPLAHSISRSARETDLVTRASDARFQVLLPETTELEAMQFARRVVADCEIWLHAAAAPVVVRAVAAEATHDRPLDDALSLAIEAVEG
jgi:GGDEF domain-containing protein